MANILVPRRLPQHQEDIRRAAGGNALRAGVLGANDGLVSNLSLVMGVAGAQMSGANILITGLAGLLAGASSMALGEWLSVQSARELYSHEIEKERRALRETPDEEFAELTDAYVAKGLSREQAEATARAITADPERALEEHVREELAIDPEELGGSAWQAAGVSFGLFAVGAIIPVVPFVVLAGWSAVVTSLALSAVGLFILGGAITRFTGRGFMRSGGRQVLFGIAASALTFGIGRLIGVSLAG